MAGPRVDARRLSLWRWGWKMRGWVPAGAKPQHPWCARPALGVELGTCRVARLTNA